MLLTGKNCFNEQDNVTNNVLCPPTEGAENILLLMRILLAYASGLAFAFAKLLSVLCLVNRLVDSDQICTDIYLGHRKQVIRFW